MYEGTTVAQPQLGQQTMSTSAATLPLPSPSPQSLPGMRGAGQGAVGAAMHGLSAPGQGHQAWVPSVPQQHEIGGNGIALGAGSVAGRSLKSRLVGPRSQDSTAAAVAAVAAAAAGVMGGGIIGGQHGGAGMGIDVSGAGGGAGNHGLLEINLDGRVMSHPVQMPMHLGGGLATAVGAAGVDGMVDSMDTPGRAEQRRRR